MALIDDINALPPVVGDGNTGHLNNHQVIHAALKNHESRLISGTAYVDGRVPSSLALRLDTTSGTRVMAGTNMIFGDTGWRNITGNLVNGWTAEIVRIRRQGNLVTLEHRGLSAPAVENLAWITLPAGFADPRTMIPITTRTGVFASTASNSLGCSFHTVVGFTLDTYALVTSTWSVSALWPSTLPGTPA